MEIEGNGDWSLSPIDAGQSGIEPAAHAWRTVIQVRQSSQQTKSLKSSPYPAGYNHGSTKYRIFAQYGVPCANLEIENCREFMTSCECWGSSRLIAGSSLKHDA